MPDLAFLLRQLLVRLLIPLREAAESHFHFGMGLEERTHLADGDFRRIVNRTIHAATRPLARPSGSPSAKFPSETSFYGAFPSISSFAALNSSVTFSPCAISSLSVISSPPLQIISYQATPNARSVKIIS